ncbi:MAG: hypothetical protein V4692_03105 [Bdellovibrionota bacterium]
MPTEFVRAKPFVVVSGGNAPAAQDEKSEDETRAGLRRLADLIRDKRRAVDPETPEEKRKPASLHLVKKTGEIGAAPKEDSPVEDTEVRYEVDSYHMTSFILNWQRRRKKQDPVTEMILLEQKRRKIVAVYQDVQARGPQAAQPEPLLPALSY